MEVLDREELGTPILEPLRARERLVLRTMPVAAAVEGDPLLAAAENRRVIVVTIGRHATPIIHIVTSS